MRTSALSISTIGTVLLAAVASASTQNAPPAGQGRQGAAPCELAEATPATAQMPDGTIQGPAPTC
jgi:hypothetical protein